jgi:hypothetical protein
MNPKGFTYFDTVTVPYGCYLSAPSYTIHHLANFENPDGLRFYKLLTGGENQVGEEDGVLNHSCDVEFGVQNRKACLSWEVSMLAFAILLGD